MKNKLRRGLDTLKYLPVVALPFLAQDLKGQVFPSPPAVINPFLSPDTTEVAKAYNANNGLSLEAIAARNSLADIRVKSDRTHTIPDPYDVLIWNCNHWTQLQIVNGYDWGDGIYEYGGGKLVYNGYKGWDLAQIYANGGTFADQAKLGLPLFKIEFIINPDTREAHTQTTLLTGNYALKGEDWNDIEPRDGITNVKPGEINIPLNTDYFVVTYMFVGKTDLHEKVLAGWPILKFKIVDGKKILTYNINDDPLYNQRIRVITERENDKPKITIQNNADPNILTWNIMEANFKSASYSVNGGPKIAIGQSGTLNMNLPTGNNNITFHTDDYFRLGADSTFQRIKTGPVNNAPTSSIKSPSEGQEYKTDIITLQYDITDKENDPITASYSINGGTKVSTEKSVNKQLKLQNGLYKILIYYADPTHASKDSVSFEVNKPVGIEPITTLENKVYPNPVENNLHIIYDQNMSGNAFMSITTLDGKPVMRKKINHTTEEDMDMTTYKPGMYIMRITDGKEKQTYKIIKR